MMSSASSSFKHRPNPFSTFNFEEFLPRPDLASMDRESGPYHLSFLGVKKQTEFLGLLGEYEQLFLPTEDIEDYRYIRSQVERGLNSEVSGKIKEAGQRVARSAHYLALSLKYGSEAYWRQLEKESPSTELEALRTRWFLHAEWSCVSAPKLSKARDLLFRIKTWTEAASQELKKGGGIEIPVPFQKENLRLKNPFTTVHPEFYERYESYLTSLLQMISKENKSLAEAMLARLEHVSESEDFTDDDVLYDLIQKKLIGRIQAVSFQKLAEYASILNGGPRRSLSAETFQVFHIHVLEGEDELQCRRLKDLKWLRADTGIPVNPVLHQTTLLLRTRDHLKLDLPVNVQLYGLAQFDIALLNIQALCFRFPPDAYRGNYSSAAVKMVNLDKIVHHFGAAFTFLRESVEAAHRLTTENKEWNMILYKRCEGVLGFARPFLCFIDLNKTGVIDLEFGQTYLDFLKQLRDFCLFFKDVYAVESEVVSSCRLVIFSAPPTLFKMWIKFLKEPVFNRQGACNTLSLLEICIQNSKGIKVVRELLFEGRADISYADLKEALVDPSFGLKEQEIYEVTKLVLEKTHEQRNPRQTSCIFRLLQAFDQEYRTNLVGNLTKEYETRRRASIDLLEQNGAELARLEKTDSLPFDQILMAVFFLNEFRDIVVCRDAIERFIETYLRYYKGSDFHALDSVLMGTESQVDRFCKARVQKLLQEDLTGAVVDEQTEEGFKKIFAKHPFLREGMASILLPTVTGLIEQIPEQMHACMHQNKGEVPTILVGKFTLVQLTTLIRLFLPNPEPELEKVDTIPLKWLETLIENKGIEERGRKFLETILFNLPEFPLAGKTREKVNDLLKKLVSMPWSLEGYEICRFLAEPENPFLKKYNLQLLRRLLQDKEGSFCPMYEAYLRENKVPELLTLPVGFQGIQEFYHSDDIIEVLREIGAFLKRPYYHPYSNAVLRRHLTPTPLREESSTRELDRLIGDFKNYDGFQKEAWSALRALRHNNFGQFTTLMGQVHSFILDTPPSPAILCAYAEFLTELDEEFRKDLHSLTEDRSRYIVAALQKKYPTSEEEIFAPLEMNCPEQFGLYKRALEWIRLTMKYHVQIREIYRAFIYNIKKIYSSDQDWIFCFNPECVYTCLNVFTNEERSNLFTALSFLNAEKYNIFSKEALEALLRLLKKDADNPERELQTIADGHTVATCSEAHRKLSSHEERTVYRNGLVGKHDRLLAKGLAKILINEASREARRKIHDFETLMTYLFLEDPKTAKLDRLTVDLHHQRILIHSYLWGIRAISPIILRQLFKENGEWNGERGYNTHVNIPITTTGSSAPLVHTKFLPSDPGTQRATKTMHTLLWEDPFPQQELAKFPAGTGRQERDYPVLLSEHIPGSTIHAHWLRGETIRIHRKSFSQIFIDGILTRIRDGKPENIMCQPIENTDEVGLVMIENEDAYGDVVVRQGADLHLEHRFVLYCFYDEMHQTVHPDVVQTVRDLDIYGYINTFISNMVGYNTKMSQVERGLCFFSPEEMIYWANHPSDPVKIPFTFLDGSLVRKTIDILMQLQEIFLENQAITHVEVLRRIYPQLSPFYIEALNNKDLSTKARWDATGGKEYPVVHGTYKTRHNYLSTTLIPDTRELTDPEVLGGGRAKDSLKSSEQLIRQLKPVRTALLSGDIRPFKALNSDLRDKVLNGIPQAWIRLDVSRLEAVHQALYEVFLEGHCIHLDFSGWNTLTDTILHRILEKNTFLQILDLSRCTQISIPELVPKLSTSCPLLQVLKLNRTSGRYMDYAGIVKPEIPLNGRNPLDHPFIKTAYEAVDFSQPYGMPLMLHSEQSTVDRLWNGQVVIFHHLKFLDADNCPELRSIALVAPVLQRLRARGCPELSNLKVLTFGPCEAFLDDSPRVQQTDRHHLALSCYNIPSLQRAGSTLVFSAERYKIVPLDLFALDYTLSHCQIAHLKLDQVLTDLQESRILNTLFQILARYRNLHLSYPAFTPNIAFKWFKKRVEIGDISAKVMIGRAYLDGDGVHQNYPSAIAFFEEAAAQGSLDAYFYLGRLFSGGRVTINFPRAVECLEYGAGKGHAECQCALANLYKKGLGKDKNPDEAAKWFEKAAQQNHTRSQYELALYLLSKREAEGDSQAIQWLTRAGDYPLAQLRLGQCYIEGRGVARDVERGYTIVKRIAELGVPAGQVSLGHCYAMGLGVPQDLNAAREWYRKGAIQDYVPGQIALADFLKASPIVSARQEDTPSYWWEKAAREGDANAQYELGVFLFERGSISRYQAVEWFKKAAEQGHPRAFFYYGWQLLFGQGILKNEGEGLTNLTRAYELNVTHATYVLGCYYYSRYYSNTDTAVLKQFTVSSGDIDKFAEHMQMMLQLFRKAADQNHPLAMYMLGICYSCGRGVTMDEAASRQWFQRAFEELQKEIDHFPGRTYQLGVYYRDIARDPVEAERWLKRAKELRSNEEKRMI